MTKQKHRFGKPAWVLAATATVSVLWCIAVGIPNAADGNLPLALLLLAAPVLLLWSAVLLALCLMQLRDNAGLLAEISARLPRPAAETEEEQQLQAQLLQARRESAALANALRQEWRELCGLLARLHEQGDALREKGEEMEGMLRETASALPLILERSLAQLGQHLEDSRQQIGILIRARAELEAALSQERTAQGRAPDGGGGEAKPAD